MQSEYKHICDIQTIYDQVKLKFFYINLFVWKPINRSVYNYLAFNRKAFYEPKFSNLHWENKYRNIIAIRMLRRITRKPSFSHIIIEEFFL